MHFDLKYVFHTDLPRPVLTQIGQFQWNFKLCSSVSSTTWCPIYTFNFEFFRWTFCILLILLHCIMKYHVTSATNAVIICITVFSFYIFIENCVLDLSSFQLNEHNKMTLNKVPYNGHRAHGPCHCGPQNSGFLLGYY